MREFSSHEVLSELFFSFSWVRGDFMYEITISNQLSWILVLSVEWVVCKFDFFVEVFIIKL